MVFKAWKTLDHLNVVIRHLWLFILVLVILNVFLLVSLAMVPNRMRVYIPPDLSQGAMIHPGQIPKAVIYAFAFQIFTAINSWPEDGTKDYGKNIHAYQNYLSPTFYQKLEQDNTDRAANGELARKRMMSGISGMGYQPSSVKPLGNGTWLVNMHLQIVETLSGSVIKSVMMDYPLIVSRVRASIQVNPWGLVLSGYTQQPYRIKTIV